MYDFVFLINFFGRMKWMSDWPLLEHLQPVSSYLAYVPFYSCGYSFFSSFFLFLVYYVIHNRSFPSLRDDRLSSSLYVTFILVFPFYAPLAFLVAYIATLCMNQLNTKSASAVHSFDCLMHIPTHFAFQFVPSSWSYCSSAVFIEH